jgi:hypothetical protein
MRPARIAAVVAAISVVLVTLTGCGQKQEPAGERSVLPAAKPASSHRSVTAALDDMLQAYVTDEEKVAVIIEGIQDEASYKAALPELEKTTDHLREINQKSQVLFKMLDPDQFGATARAGELITKQQQIHDRLVAARARIEERLPDRAKELDEMLRKGGIALPKLVKK